MPITVPGEGKLDIVMQWDEAFGLALSDMDIILYDSKGVPLQSAPGDGELHQGNMRRSTIPGEMVTLENLSPLSVEVFLGIELVSGQAPGLFQFVPFADGFFESEAFSEDKPKGPTIYGHSNGLGVASVGAAAYQDTPPFTTTPPEINPSSSLGGTPILFDPLGRRIYPQVRLQPSVVGPDGVDTTFFGFEDTDQTGNPNFFGTSASAPHAAGLAALMLQLNPSLSPAETIAIMEDTALDMDDPGQHGFQRGFDFRSGHGLLQSVGALSAASGQPALSTMSSGNTTDTVGASGMVEGKASDGGDAIVRVSSLST